MTYSVSLLVLLETRSVSTGAASRDKVPVDIKGTPSIDAGAPLLPHPAMARLIESRVKEATKPTRVERLASQAGSP